MNMCMPEHRENDLLARIGSESENRQICVTFLGSAFP